MRSLVSVRRSSMRPLVWLMSWLISVRRCAVDASVGLIDALVYLAHILTQILNILAQETESEGGFSGLGGIGRLLGHEKVLFG